MTRTCKPNCRLSSTANSSYFSTTMPRRGIRKLNLPPPPPSPPWCISHTAQIIDHLVQKHRAQTWQVEHIVGCLNESYLLSLPKLRNDTHDHHDTSPKRLRWLFYSWTARILGWRNRREEGDEDGLSPEVYQVIREVVYPFPKLERPQTQRNPSPEVYRPCFPMHSHSLELHVLN